MDENSNVGGQAVIEGVMMRAPRAMAVAVRRASGELLVWDEPWKPLGQRFLGSWAKVPVLRGVVVLVESLLNGFQALTFAAEQAEQDARGRPPGPPGALLLGLLSAMGEPAGPKGMSARERVGSLALSVVLAISLFVALPHILAWLVGWLTGGHWGVDSFLFHLLDGVFKLAIFVGYVALIGQIPEARRVFEYHGAEHKVVNAFEKGRPLDLDEVRLHGTFHARCGTSFVLFVLVTSIVFFSVLLPLIPAVSSNPILNHLFMVMFKVPLMAPLAGVAYEVNRWAAAHPGTALVSLLVSPGRWMQRITTREPDDDQLEVALAAMKVALHREARMAAGHNDEACVEAYRDLSALETALGPATA